MSTGTIQKGSKTIHKNISGGVLKQTFTAGEALSDGDVVTLSANFTVSKASGTDAPVGTVVVSGANGELVTVAVTLYSVDALGVATGGTLAVGSFVKNKWILH